MRFYFLRKEKPYNLLLESSYQLGKLREYDKVKGTNNNFSLLAGTSLYFNKTIGLEFLLGYNRFFSFTEDDNNNEAFCRKRLQNGLQFNIGLMFHLEKK
ncbi:MAG: hypothetical protein EAZ51_07815 [Sphingobacteriales bacterium]|nr:MAG: hypothetical protein EAZ64_05535 [Sphingobacteriales bacterium]TAF79335.1 MAG: hypothetical protein EAZ51_07815 [Sphingobacteriales bacterium]